MNSQYSNKSMKSEKIKEREEGEISSKDSNELNERLDSNCMKKEKGLKSIKEESGNVKVSNMTKGNEEKGTFDDVFKRPMKRSSNDNKSKGHCNNIILHKSSIPQHLKDKKDKAQKPPLMVNIALNKKKITYAMITSDLINGKRLQILYQTLNNHFKNPKEMNVLTNIISNFSKEELISSLFFMMTLINQYDDITKKNSQHQCIIINDIWDPNNLNQITSNCKKNKELTMEEYNKDKNIQSQPVLNIKGNSQQSPLSTLLNKDEKELLNKKRQHSKKEEKATFSSDDHEDYNKKDKKYQNKKRKNEKIETTESHNNNQIINNSNNNFYNPTKKLTLNQTKILLEKDINSCNILSLLRKCEANHNYAMIQGLLHNKNIYLDYESSTPTTVIVHETFYSKIKVTYSKEIGFSHSVEYQNVKESI